MDIVDIGPSGRGSASSGSAESWPSRPGLRGLQRLPSTHLAGLLAALGFVLVLGSQMYPWVHVTHRPSRDALGLIIPADLGILGSTAYLQIPYFILWFGVFAATGVTLFAAPSRRRPAFGVAVGAMAAQLLIVLPVLRHPAQLLSSGLVSAAPKSLVFVHTLGSYLVIAAFIVLAAALVVAVNGHVLPGPVPVPEADVPVPAVPRHRDVAADDTLPLTEEHADVVDDTDEEWDETSPVALAPDLSDRRSEAADHSMFQRPVPTADAVGRHTQL